MQLYVYDLSGGMARTWSPVLLGRQVGWGSWPGGGEVVAGVCPPPKQIDSWTPLLSALQLDGIWHTAVVVHGREIFFGGGINVARAGYTPFGRPVQVGLGVC